jgi:hypothetical protein
LPSEPGAVDSISAHLANDNIASGTNNTTSHQTGQTFNTNDNCNTNDSSNSSDTLNTDGCNGASDTNGAGDTHNNDETSSLYNSGVRLKNFAWRKFTKFSQEVFLVAIRHKGASCVIGFLSMLISVAIVIVFGESHASIQQMRDFLNSNGAKTIQLLDNSNLNYFDDSFLSFASGIDQVEYAFETSSVFDVFNASVDDSTNIFPAKTFQGDVSQVIRLVSGRLPQEGEAIVSKTVAEGMRFDGPVGEVGTNRKSLGRRWCLRMRRTVVRVRQFRFGDG